jgi:RHS repeat-associated protein
VGSTTSRYSLVTNPQSSVSLLLDLSGNPKQSYGYSAYGQANSTLTQNGSLSATLNPYRFQAKRLDTVFNTYDMGARRYSLTTSRWQQQDVYYDASQDLGLSQGVMTADRYEFGGGDPVNFVEADGHCSNAASGSSYVPGPPNGCGPGGWIGKLIPDAINYPIKGLMDFTHACNQHDLCYGHHFGNVRKRCDDNFLRGMNTWCDDNHKAGWEDWLTGNIIKITVAHKLCLGIAEIYYHAVRGTRSRVLTLPGGLPLYPYVSIRIPANKLGREDYKKQQLKICPYTKNGKRDIARCKKAINAKAY